MKSVLFCVILLVFPIIGSATEIEEASVKQLMLHRGFKDFVFVTLDVDRQSYPTCHVNRNWDFILDISDEFGKAIYSALLAMRLSGSSGTFTGTGTCSLYHSGETLNRLKM